MTGFLARVLAIVLLLGSGRCYVPKLYTKRSPCGRGNTKFRKIESPFTLHVSPLSPSSGAYNQTLTKKIIQDYNNKNIDDATMPMSTAVNVSDNNSPTPPPPSEWILVTLAMKMLKHDKTPITRWVLSGVLKIARLVLRGTRLVKIALQPSNRKTTGLGALGVAALVVVQRHLKYIASLTTELSFSSFMTLLKSNPERIHGLKVTADSFMFLLDGKSRVLTRVVPVEANLLDKLILSGVDFSTPSSPKSVLGLVWTLCYCVFLWKMSSRMMQGPKDEGAGSRKDNSYSNISFEDVAGQDLAKLEVKEVCDMLKSPGKFAQIGARLPSGVLLVGPPGSGKTLLARVSAAEAKVPFFACSASDFVEVFVGRGPARVRKLFKQAADNAPCIVFIDEIDSIGRSRRMGSMNSEQENTLNQILTCMDGLDTSNNGVIVMGATNRVELLDPALLRAGRFDRIVQCPLPDKNGREAILRVHTRKLKLGTNVDLEKIARAASGLCGADLAAITNEAAIRTLRRNGTSVDMQDLEDALKSYFQSRGMPLSGLAESLIPDWIKNGGLAPSMS